MTNEQFERVFQKAQDIQAKTFTKREINAAEKALIGFEVEGVEKEATLLQAAYILNLMCMGITGEYNSNVLIQMRELYLTNVKIIRAKSSKGSTKRKRKKK